MRSKKILAGLLMLGVIASSCALFNQYNIKEAFADTIKQDVVYTKTDTSTSSEDVSTLSKDANEALKSKSLNALQKYFNESPEKYKDWDFNSSILSEKTLDRLEKEELKYIDEFEKNGISSEEFNKRKEDVKQNYIGLHDTISKLKHGFIQGTLINGDDIILIFFNENTKEIEWIIGPNNMDKLATSKTDNNKLSDEQIQNIAEDFIKEHNLGDIENPKFSMFLGKQKHYGVFYEDENDPTKKVKLNIDPSTNKVYSVAIKSYANMFYEAL